MIDRTKYMDRREAKRLRQSTEAWSLSDLRDGRRQGVVAWMLVDLALCIGARPNEYAGSRLRVRDIDLTRSLVRIQRSKRRKPVTDSVAIPPNLVAHLREFLRWKRAVGESLADDAPLLCSERGPYSTSGLRKLFGSAVERSGLPASITLKSARHTLAVALLERTGNLRLVQQQLGHARIETTTVYAGVDFQGMRRAVTGVYA